MPPLLPLACLFLFVFGGLAQERTDRVLVADAYYWTGPEGNLGAEITGKFQSEQKLEEVLDLSAEIGLFKDRKYPFNSRTWRLRDILVSADFNGNGSIAIWQASGPKPLILGYLDRLKKRFEDESVFYDLSYRIINFKPSTSRLLGIARHALGEQAIPFRATLFEKSGPANWLVVWHQDTALPLASRFDALGWGPWSTKAGILYSHAPAWALSSVIALRLHLDASTSENGPLRVVPGSHEMGVLADEVSGSARWSSGNAAANNSRVIQITESGTPPSTSY